VTNKLTETILAVAVVAALTFGVARSATNRYKERLQAIEATAQSERKRLGLTDKPKDLVAKYPTPEIQLCRLVTVLPGSTAEVVIKGKFAPGTKFLFENDIFGVVKETVTAGEYRATISAPRNSGPTYAYLHAFSPVSHGEVSCLAVLVGGKYQWEFTADNGWRIRLSPVSQKTSPDAKTLPEQFYRADFFRGAEAKAFITLDAKLNMVEAPPEDRYLAHLSVQQPKDMAELEKLQQRMQDMSKLSPQEMEQLMERMGQLAEKMADPNQGIMAGVQEMTEMGCGEIRFRVQPDGVKGELACSGRGPVPVKGTMKFLGPW